MTRYQRGIFGLGVLLGAQTTLCTKYGGLPWLPPGTTWPRCVHCGRATEFWAQFTDVQRDATIGADEVVCVFACGPGLSPRSAPRPGCDRELVTLLADARGCVVADLPPGVAPRPEARLVAWEEDDDSLPDVPGRSFLWYRTPEDVRGRLSDRAPDGRAIERSYGGLTVGRCAPIPVIATSSLPGEGWRYLLEFGCTARLGRLPHVQPDDIGCEIRDYRSEEERVYLRRFLWWRWRTVLPFVRKPRRKWRGAPWNPTSLYLFTGGLASANVHRLHEHESLAVFVRESAGGRDFRSVIVDRFDLWEVEERAAEEAVERYFAGDGDEGVGGL